jgi:2-iminobutanoate/2-iminopropanoate deaminase
MSLFSRSFTLPFVLGVVASLMLVSLAGSQGRSDRRYIEPGGPTTDNPNRAFSRGLRMGNTLYIAGNTGTRGTSGNLDADIEMEIRTLLDATKDMVEAEGMTMDDIVWFQVYCTDLSLYGKFNDIYRTYFTGPLPTRAFIGTSTLLGGAHFETMGMAVEE